MGLTEQEASNRVGQYVCHQRSSGLFRRGRTTRNPWNSSKLQLCGWHWDQWSLRNCLVTRKKNAFAVTFALSDRRFF
jgi:hypothetical protein